ncbi:alpha/beta hydrolase [Candidatus Dependentiae bacterium]|nr:alpha/beta hydrolase [Candidatus Dependentiae bacterium]
MNYRMVYFITMIYFMQSVMKINAYEQKKAFRFFNDATEESIVFYARESLTSPKKIARKAIIIKRPKAKATVLICHGFMCDKYDISLLHVMFKDYNSVAFDFRAHGEESEGQCCSLGRDESYDVTAIAEYIKKHPDLKNTPLLVYGFSMGAVAAIIAQAQKNLFDGMILDCPYDSTDKLLDRGFKNLKISIFGYQVGLPGTSLLRTYAYNSYVQSMLKALLRSFSKFDSGPINLCVAPAYPEEAIKYVKVPCFFIGCVNDDKAPEEAVLSVYKGAQGFKRCWIDPDGRRHFDTLFRQTYKYIYKVDRFIKKVINSSYKQLVQEKISKDRPQSHINTAYIAQKVVD